MDIPSREIKSFIYCSAFRIIAKIKIHTINVVYLGRFRLECYSDVAVGVAEVFCFVDIFFQFFGCVYYNVVMFFHTKMYYLKN